MRSWASIRSAIRADLQSRNLAQPARRLSALDRVEELLVSVYPGFRGDPSQVLAHGKDAVRARLSRAKGNQLNGAEQSVLNQVFQELSTTRAVAGSKTTENDESPPRSDAPEEPIPEDPSPSQEVVAFTREWLAARGFVGFTRLRDLDLKRVPEAQGVYVLLREAPTPPRILEESPAGRFKGRDPTAPSDLLEGKWVDGAHCVYIGKADLTPRTSLRKRVTDFRSFGSGRDIGHYGGRYVWQVADAEDYLVAWMVTSEPPANVEADLVDEFEQLHGSMPFGNIARPRRRRNE